jgi:hypothetical protein
LQVAAKIAWCKDPFTLAIFAAISSAIFSSGVCEQVDES